MKFAESLKFNIVPEWRDDYLNYDGLKDKIYSLDAKVVDGKLQKLDAEEAFLKDVKKNLDNIEHFYQSKSEEVLSAYYELSDFLRTELKLHLSNDSSSSSNDENKFDDEEAIIENFAVSNSVEDDEKNQTSKLEKVITSQSILSQNSFIKNSSLMTNINDDNFEKQGLIISAKKKIIQNFIDLSELKSFIELNKVGFSKITKKFDKTLNCVTREPFLESIETETTIFNPETINSIDEKIERLFQIYADLTNQTIEEVKNDLKIYLREQIIMERSVVWKDLLSLENNTTNVKVSKQIDSQHAKKFWTFKIYKDHTLQVPKFLISKPYIMFYICLVITFILLFVKTLNDRVQGRCLALLACCAYLWATETIPLFATSLLVPFLTVVMKVLKNDDGTLMGGKAASKYILAEMFSSVIMLLLGGFTLAAALSKYNIAKFLSSYILYASGTNPKRVLLAIMGISMFLSMWISNVAAPVLCFSLIQPILRSIPTDSPIATALVLGIALASNAGGMASPISSPQNVIAIEYMNPNPGWGQWFAVALPVCFFELMGIWGLLCFTFKFNGQRIKAVTPIKERFSLRQWFVIIICLGTIILWCVLTKVGNVFGESGIISCIPMVVFFGTGILSPSDLNAFPWNIVVLAQGGLALGAAVTSSGLLKTVALSLQARIETYPLFAVMIIFGIVILFFATFVSHTVAVVIIIPLVKEVGESLPNPRPNVLVMGCTLLASAAMGLPTSGFPNVTAVGLVDAKGQRYVEHKRFLKSGLPASLVCFLVIISLGYGIMFSLFPVVS